MVTKAVTECVDCGKNSYRNKAAAVHGALEASRRTGTDIRIYRCPHGRGLHLTRQREWKP